MAIPPNFNPTISRQSTGNKATIVIRLPINNER